MSGTAAHDWKPRNLGGTIRDDPREELTYWAHSVPNDQPWVAVPVKTLKAAAAVQECAATTTLYNDEDGPLPQPITIHCRKPTGHRHGHHNGYCGWSA